MLYIGDGDVPFSLHGQFTLDDLDQILVVHPAISFFEHEYLFVRSAEQNLIEDIFVCSCTFTSSVEEVEITPKGS